MSTDPREESPAVGESESQPATPDTSHSSPEVTPATPESSADASSSTPETTTPATSPVSDSVDTPAPPTQASETQSAPETTPPSDAPAPAADSPTPASPTSDVPASDSPAPNRKPIQIGSRRGSESAATPQASKPQVSGTDKPINPDVPVTIEEMPTTADLVPSAPVPKPSVRDELPADLQSEIDAALGGASIDTLMGDSGGQEGSELETDSRRRAFVLKVEGEHVFFSLGGPHEGIAALRQFKKPPEPGDPMDVIVGSYNSDDGIYEVRIPGAAISAADWSDVEEGTVVEARITGSNTGGLECMVGGLRAFMPASQIEVFRVENFNDYIGQKLTCVVTEAKPQKKNLVLSHRAIREREREEERKETLEKLEVGQIVEGKVSSIRDFGVFVDIGGLDGLIHISQLSWDHIKDPREVMQEGEAVRVKIEKINAQTGKIGLGFRDLMEHPWHNVEDQVQLNAVIKGPVTRIAKFGAFVKIAPGVEGLIHISEISHQRIASVGAVLSEGQEVEAKVLSIDKEAQRIGLSIKATQAAPEKPAEAEEEEKPRELAVKPRKGPLKGGTRGTSGGDQFGLKW